MFGADYATFAPYIEKRPHNGGNSKENGFIPDYLLPKFEPVHPWDSSSEPGLEEDFIMVAEFCEIEGPKPMMCIPKEGGSSFNKNDYAVKIMAVDLQTSTQGFSISEDTQVVISDAYKAVYSFVHHFVLFDTEARGFVRSFCIAYITSDKRKLMNFYEQMSLQFKKVARFMKYGNRLVFIKDLERHLLDLQFSKGQLRVKNGCPDGSEMNSSENEVYQDLEKIRQAINETQQILNILKPLMNDTKLEDYLRTLEEKAGQHLTSLNNQETVSLSEQIIDNENGKQFSCSWTESGDAPFSLFCQKKPYTPKFVEVTRKKKFDNTLRSIHEMCSWGAKEGIKKLRQIHEYYNRETLIIQIEQEEMALTEPAGSLVTCGQCITSNFLSGLKLGLQEPSSLSSGPLSSKYLNLSHQSLSDSFKSLSTFGSFEDDGDMYYNEQMSPMSLISDSYPTEVAADENTAKPKPLSGRMNSEVSCGSGSTSSLYQTDEAPSMSDSTQTKTKSNLDREKDAGMMRSDTSGLSELANQNIQSNNLVSVSSNVEDSTKETLFSCLVNTSESDRQEVGTNLPVSGLTNHIVISGIKVSEPPSQAVMLVDQYSDSRERKTSVHRSADDSFGTCQLYDLNTSNLTPGSNISISPNYCADMESVCEMKDVSSFTSGKLKSDFSQQPLVNNEETNGENLDTFPNSYEEGLTHTSSFSSSFPTSRKPKNGLFSLGDSISKLEPGMPGFGVLGIISAYNSLINIVFSLLTGRTVFVVGSFKMENEVIAVVKALSIFLPDHRRKHSSVVEWLSKPLRITDLGRIKLAGVCRPEKKALEKVIPSVIKKYVSVFDMEKKIVTAPRYQGNQLHIIFGKRKAFSSDAEFITFLHCWLMEISSRAFIFYHSFCLGSAGSFVHDYGLHTQSEHYRNTVKSFMAKLGLIDSDVHIIEYLCEIVKMSEIESGEKQINSDTGCTVRPISLSHESCEVFQN